MALLKLNEDHKQNNLKKWNCDFLVVEKVRVSLEETANSENEISRLCFQSQGHYNTII